MPTPLLLLFSLFVILFLSCCRAAPPSFNLTTQTIIQTELSGRMHSMGNGTYPRAHKLSDPEMPNDSIVGVHTAFSRSDNIIQVVTSADDGRSWKYRGEVTRGPSNASFVDHAYILQLPNKKLICAFSNHSKDPRSGKMLYYRITVHISHDYGSTWYFHSNAETKPATSLPNGMWEPFLRNAHNSTQIYWSQELADDDQDLVMKTSPNLGKTWNPTITTVAGSSIRSRDGMAGITTISNTTIIAVFESHQHGQFTIKSVTSPNDGKTWSNRALVYAPSGGEFSSAAAPQIANVGGLLCVSFLTNEDDGPKGPTATSFDKTTAVKLVVSGDGGLSWGNKITVGRAMSLWAGLLSLGPTELLA
ncbi:MAG: hypothetical protein Q9164_004093, partial [Protoblastenia rupestris]